MVALISAAYCKWAEETGSLRVGNPSRHTYMAFLLAFTLQKWSETWPSS